MEYTVYIKLTNSCNLRCQHCYNANADQTKTMSDDQLQNVAKYLRIFKGNNTNCQLNVQLHGGEPMLYDTSKLIEFVSSLADVDIKWSITTNLVYKLDAEKIRFFKMMLPYDDKPYIMTSWDKDIRFQGDQEKIWTRNVKKLLKSGIEVQPIICITQQLISQMTAKEVIDKMMSIGIKHINFERITNTGNAAGGSFTPLNKSIDLWLYDAYEYAKQKGIYVPLFESVEDSVKGFLTGCRARRCMKTVLTINPDCTVSACPNTSSIICGILKNGYVIENKIKKTYLNMTESKKDTRCILCRFYRYCNAECCQLKYDSSGCPGLTKIYDALLN